MVATPTATELKSRFPVFAAVADGAVENALALAAQHVSDAWSALDAKEGIFLYAAHVMTFDGLGTSAEAADVLSGLAGVKSYQSGSFSVDRSGKADVSPRSGSLLARTSYGQRFLELARLNVPGPVVA